MLALVYGTLGQQDKLYQQLVHLYTMVVWSKPSPTTQSIAVTSDNPLSSLSSKANTRIKLRESSQRIWYDSLYTRKSEFFILTLPLSLQKNLASTHSFFPSPEVPCAPMRSRSTLRATSSNLPGSGLGLEGSAVDSKNLQAKFWMQDTADSNSEDQNKTVPDVPGSMKGSAHVLPLSFGLR